jgi:hypothetical protein
MLAWLAEVVHTLLTGKPVLEVTFDWARSFG